MKPGPMILVGLLPLIAFQGSAACARQMLTIRGQEQLLELIAGAKVNETFKPPVVFLPGDGGWRGLAVSMAQTIASWGYDVYGLDVKRYLESFTVDGKATLTDRQMAADLRAVVDQVGSGRTKPVIVGWSQGAGMAVLAASSEESRLHVGGVVTVGLPQSAVLGWRFKDSLAVIARQDPDEPHFQVTPILAALSAPVWMIHAAGDEYSRPQDAQKMFDAVRAPKQFRLIQNTNHRFDGRRDDFYRSLKEGLEWLAAQSR